MISLLRSLRSKLLRAKQVRTVLRSFKHMGASRDELANERKRLSSDDGYLDEWYTEVKS